MELRIRQREIDIDAILQRLKRRRRKQRRPALRLADTGGNHRLGEHRLEPRVAGVRQPRFQDFRRIEIAGLHVELRENVEEVVAHQRLVVADRQGDGDGLGEVCAEIDGGALLLRRVEILRVHVARAARQLEVFEEALLVIHAARAVVLEPLVEQVRLQRAERRRKLLRVRPSPLQPRLALHGVELRIRIRARRELAHPRKDERLIVRECRDALRQLIELLRQ